MGHDQCALIFARMKSRGQRSSMIDPIALEAVQRLDELFDIKRGINGKTQPSGSRSGKNSARR